MLNKCIFLLKNIMLEDDMFFFQQDISNTTVKANNCKHEVLEQENGKQTCLDCGVMLNENYIINDRCSNVIGMRRRRKPECTIQNTIPSFISQTVKNKTVDIYNIITDNKIFRNTSKKAIILASLHRASAILNEHISYYDLLDMFSLKQFEANKGFVLMYTRLPKTSESIIIFDIKKEEEICISSRISNLGIFNDSFQEMFNLVKNVFEVIKLKSSLFDKAQPNSIICGCIYFWVVHKNIPKTVVEFAAKAGISKMTLITVYISICTIVYKNILPFFLSHLFKNCKPQVNDDTKKFNAFTTELYNPIHKIIIFNPFSKTDLKITTNPKKKENRIEYPLHTVTDVFDWNIFLDTSYYTKTHKYVLDIKLVKKINSVEFDFKDYNTANETCGHKILCDFLLNFYNRSL
jgi:transcription initiation factor TFIIIB Brf1 subunit/transcription initiation factor TFIIB